MKNNFKDMVEIEFENIYYQIQKGNFFFEDLEKELNRLMKLDFVYNVKELKFNCLGYIFELNPENPKQAPLHIFKNVDDIFIVAEYREVGCMDEGVLKMNIKKNGNVSILFSNSEMHHVIFTERFEIFKKNVVNIINNG